MSSVTYGVGSRQNSHATVLPTNNCSILIVTLSRSTIFVRLTTNNHDSLKYQPGDHLGVYPGNQEDLVMPLIEKLEDAPPVNQIVRVEFLDERNTALGNSQ